MHCSAHVLYLMVNDGLDKIVHNIERVRNNVWYWTATPKWCQDFDDIQTKECRANDTKKLILDVKTIWNSTYY